MARSSQIIALVVLLAAPCLAQQKSLWVLKPTGDMLEYDLTTFATKQTVKVPLEAAKSPASVSVNQSGQILFAPTVSLPLSDEDVTSTHKVWFWNGHAATTVDAGVQHRIEAVGSNQAVTELAPAVFLSADGNHLSWFANQQRRLECRY